MTKNLSLYTSIECFSSVSIEFKVGIRDEDHLDRIHEHGAEGEGHGNVVQDLDRPHALLRGHVHRAQEHENYGHQDLAS